MKKLLLYLILFLSSELFPQSLVYNLSKIAGGYAKNYVQPMVNAFGADVNSGFYSVNGENNKFSFQFGIKMFASFVPDDALTFSGRFNDIAYYRIGAIEYPVKAEVIVENAPTVFGSSTPAIAQVNLRDTVRIGGISYPVNETRYQETIGGAIQSQFTPIGVPEVIIGKYFGTEAIFRWLPSINLSGYGSTSFWGAGIKHHFNSYMSFLPIDITVQLLMQDFNVKDSAGNKYVNSSASAINLNISKQISSFVFYSGFQYETFTVDIDYLYTPENRDVEPVRIQFESEAKNNIRFFLGTSVKFGSFNLYIDYSIAYYDVFSGGILLKI